MSVYGLYATNSSEIAKIVHDFMKKDICRELDRINCPPPIYIGPVKVKSLKERLEETKMKKATSVQKIENVNGVSFSIENYPMEEESKLTIVASTNDDIFEFEFEGSDLLRSCKAAGLFVGWEKDQKIKELKEEIKKLEHADMLDKEAADYWSKEHDTLSERFAKLQEENEKLEDENKNLRIQVKVLEDIKRENAELKDKLLKVLWTVADCEINKGGYKDE